jgi:hypothetical protein
VTLVLALLGTSFVSAAIILWLSPSVVAGVLLILTVSGFVLGRYSVHAGLLSHDMWSVSDETNRMIFDVN